MNNQPQEIESLPQLLDFDLPCDEHETMDRCQTIILGYTIETLLTTAQNKARLSEVEDLQIDAQDCISISGDKISEQFLDIMENRITELKEEV